MRNLSGSPRDHILWLQSEHGGKMERSRLRQYMAIRYTVLNPLLDELAREGKINIAPGKHEDIISLKER